MGKEIVAGTICWLHFHNQAKPGHAHCGDYGYIQAYAPKHSKKIEDDELYVKVAVKKLMWIFNHIRFVCEIKQVDGTLAYEICVDEPERLQPISWEHPEDLPWSVG